MEQVQCSAKFSFLLHFTTFFSQKLGESRELKLKLSVSLLPPDKQDELDEKRTSSECFSGSVLNYYVPTEPGCEV
jgi:hypothetical protein